MIRIDEVRARIEAQVPDLAGQLGNAGQFSQLIDNNRLPQRAKGGFVLPGSLSGGQVTSATGLFVQNFNETVMVVLFARVAGDPLGESGLDEISPLVRAVIEGVVGWGPDDAPGVFALSQAELVGSKDGALIYEIHFTLHDQMRVTP